VKHKTYSRLGLNQRYQISCLLTQEFSISEIARTIGVHRSTISRELKDKIASRGRSAGHYDPDKAQGKSNERRKSQKRKSRLTERVLKYLRKKLQEERWSPELISAKGKEEFGEFVSAEALYQYIYRAKHSNHRILKQDKDLHKYLMHTGRRQKRRNSNNNRGCISNRVGIEDRPKIIEKRKRCGDLEVDLMMGANRKPALIVMTDRTTRETNLIRINSKKAKYISKKILERIKRRNLKVHSLTFDNDLAFADHMKITEALNIQTYFTRPYTSQDKGSVENRIGQVRRWFRKGTSLLEVHIQTIAAVERKLNNRPFRMFGYESALERKNKLLN
jgi:IS30 family transposase